MDLPSAISQHAWAIVAGIVLLSLVQAARLPAVGAQWQRLPAPWRPYVPILLGILSGVAQALATAQPWVAALVGGIVSAIPALLSALPSPTAHLGMVIVKPTIPDPPPPKVVINLTSAGPVPLSQVAEAIEPAIESSPTIEVKE